MSIKKISSDISKDQFFLNDEKILRNIVSLANLTKSDVVLEVGAGTGNMTKLLSEKSGKVIAFEIDERYKSVLSKLPKNVEMHYENAWEYVQLHGKFWKKKEYNKIVSNLPYSFVEQFLHNLTFLEFDKVILLIPLKIVDKVKRSGVFSSFFTFDVKFIVEKEKFDPIPKTNSVVVEVVKHKKPLETKDLGLFLRQYMYQHEGQMVKNSLMEGVIKYMKAVENKTLTKNEARMIVSKSKINDEYLNKVPDSREIYIKVGEYFKNLVIE